MALSRGARFIVVFILLAATASVAAMVLTYALATRGPSVPMRAVLWLRVPGNLAERVPDDLLGQIAVGRGDTIGSVVDALRKASVDDRVEGVVLIPPAQPVMWGTLQELRDAMLDFRTSGKPLLAYLEYGGSQQYYLATAADRVLLTPTSPLDLVGVASYELFARDALDRFGVYPDMLHAGDFKTATNLFTETTFTPEHREMTASLNHDFYEQLVAGIADGREMSPEAVRELIDDGPFLPEEAVSRGLVDGLAYEDQLLQELSLDAPEPRRLDYASYRRVDPGSLGLDQGPRIAAVYALGAITL